MQDRQTWLMNSLKKEEEEEEEDEDMPGNTDVDERMLAAEADIPDWRREQRTAAQVAPESLFSPSETDEVVQRFVEKEEEETEIYR